jgi:hypothetical protein
VRVPCEAWRASDAGASGDSDGVGFLIAILTLALLGLVVFVVSGPVRRARSHASSRAPESPDSAAAGREQRRASTQRLDELDAAREAKYREIRDAELDYRTGKLSSEDYRAVDADLRAEAIAILDQLEALKPKDA